RPERLLRLDVGGVERDARDRAHLHALRLVEVADALGAAARLDDVDRLAGRDRAVRALRLADVAVDALVGDDQSHDVDARRRRSPGRAETGRVPAEGRER